MSLSHESHDQRSKGVTRRPALVIAVLVVVLVVGSLSWRIGVACGQWRAEVQERMAWTAGIIGGLIEAQEEIGRRMEKTRPFACGY